MQPYTGLNNDGGVVLPGYTGLNNVMMGALLSQAILD